MLAPDVVALRSRAALGALGGEALAVTGLPQPALKLDMKPGRFAKARVLAPWTARVIPPNGDSIAARRTCILQASRGNLPDTPKPSHALPLGGDPLLPS